jgi:hypothetical protein
MRREENMPTPPQYDVAIVGASIAGCAAAIFFGRAGARVALVERNSDPGGYKKLCTHYIQASAVPTLERLGLVSAIEEAGGVRNETELFTRWGWIGAPASQTIRRPAYEMRKMSGGKDRIRKQAFDHPSMYLRETITQRVKINGSWLALIKKERPVEGQPKILEGNLIAGDKILGDGENEYQRRILDEFDKALAVDMESYGLARGVYNARSTRHYNLNYLVVRGISDLVNAEGNDDQRKKWRDYAAATAAAFALSVTDEIVAICA